MLGAKWGEQLSLVGYSIGRKCRRWEGGLKSSTVHLKVTNAGTDGFLETNTTSLGLSIEYVACQFYTRIPVYHNLDFNL